MADDITLTVRVRDMTRGDLDRVRQRMRGMDDDIRHVGQSSDMTNERVRRLSDGINGMGERLRQLGNDGRYSNHEMQHLRRTMGLLGRDLRQAHRAGELTDDQFRRLRDRLDDTRLGYDYLDRDLQRHAGIARDAHRAEMQRQREAAAAQRRRDREERQAARERRQMLGRAEGEAYRMQAAMNRRARDDANARLAAARREARDEDRARNEAMTQRLAAIARRRQMIARAEAEAYREEAARRREAARQEREQRRQQQQDERRDRQRQQSELRRFGQQSADPDLAARGRRRGATDFGQMSSDVDRLRRAMSGITGDTDDARHNIGMFNRDLDVMSRMLRAAHANGGLTRRELRQLSDGLRVASRSARDIRRSSDLSRGGLRGMRQDLGVLRSTLARLGGDGRHFDGISSRILRFQRSMRDAARTAGFFRRGLFHMGDWGAGGMRRGVMFTGMLTSGFLRMGRAIQWTHRWMLIFMAVVALMGPVAQLLGAVLIAALGGAFVALGAFALRGSAEVKSAFKSMKTVVGATVRNAAQPLEGPLANGMRKVGDAAVALGPMLKQAFSATAPLVDDLFGAVTNLAAGALPGITQALQHAGPAMKGFSQAMGMVGLGIGDLFKNMTVGNEQGLQQAWQTIGNELQNLLSNLGTFIANMSKSKTVTAAFVGIMRLLSGALHVVEGAFDALDTVLGPVMELLSNMAMNIRDVGVGSGDAGSALSTLGKSSKELKADLKEVNKEISSTRKEIKDAGKIKGPARKMVIDSAQERLNQLLGVRASLEGAIAGAADTAATATQKEAQSIKDLVTQMQSLAELNRNYMDAQSAQYKAIADASKGNEKLGHALKFVNGHLDLTSTSAQNAYDKLSAIARTTQETSTKMSEANLPWEQIKRSWDDGYNSIVRLADGMGLSATDAKILADQILGMPPPKDIVFKVRTQEAVQSFDDLIAAYKAAPNQKMVNVKVLSADAVKTLQDLGYTVTRLPDGSFNVTAGTDSAKHNIAILQAARNALKGKNLTFSAQDIASGKAFAIRNAVKLLTDHSFTITAYYRTVHEFVQGNNSLAAQGIQAQADAQARAAKRGHAMGGLASSGPAQRFAEGGSIAGSVLEGPGSGTSDSLIARLSRGEFVMRAAAVQKYGPEFMQMVNRGLFKMPGFARGGHTSRATLRANAKAKAKARAAEKARKERAKEAAKRESDARNEARGELTISHFGKMAGYKHDEFQTAVGLPKSLSDIVDALNKWRGMIQKATHGGVEKSLLKKLDSAGKKLINYEKQLTKVTSSLEKAKTKLDDLKTASKQLKESVTNNVLQATNITNVANGDKNVTMTDIMRQMGDSVAKSSAFAGSLSDLRKRGVSKDIINQIAEAGISGGGLETAGALLTASDSEIAQINSMQKQINASANSAGKTAADAMYAAGIKAAEGMVKGLTIKKKAIEGAMMAIAKGMEKAIKKALKIKSPSKVMQEVGHYTAEGFAVGIEKNKAAPSAWESLLGPTTASTPAFSGGGGGGNGVQVIQLKIGERVLDEIILDSARRTVRTRGGNVQAVLGRK